MKAENRMKATVLVSALLLFLTSKALATVGADYVELTPAEIKSRQFELSVRKNEDDTTINLVFPKTVLIGSFTLTPRHINVAVMNKSGQVIAYTDNSVTADASTLIVTGYHHKISDVSIRVSYECPRTGALSLCNHTIFGIDSASKLIHDNPPVVDQPPCRRVPGTKVEVFDCTGSAAN